MLNPDFNYNHERAIELPLLKEYCLKQKALGKTRVIDVGGAESLYTSWLLNNGFKVTILDPCRWLDNQEWKKHISHPNFSIIKEGIENFIVGSENYDFALVISVIEHLGRGGYNAGIFETPEIVCFNNIKVPLCFTTPCGQDHYIGNPPDRNFSQSSLLHILNRSNKEIVCEKYYVAPAWKECYYYDIKDLKYSQINGAGASAIGYFEIV